MKSVYVKNWCANHKQIILNTMDERELLQECKLQLEYLNYKFGETGTTNSLLTKIEAVLRQSDVSGSLPMYDVDELNEIIKLFNNKEIDLYTCIGRIWNKSYFIGANEGMKAGQLGNDH